MRALILKWYVEHVSTSLIDWEPVDSHPLRKFSRVQHFLRDFMLRNHLSYRCVGATRRCEIRPDGVGRFKEELTAAFREFPHSDIMNADESMWLSSGSLAKLSLKRA
jgi:hypothetical protein